MDFMERWFGVSPDGGNGLYEVALLVTLAAIVVAAFRIWKRSRHLR